MEKGKLGMGFWGGETPGVAVWGGGLGLVVGRLERASSGWAAVHDAITICCLRAHGWR